MASGVDRNVMNRLLERASAARSLMVATGLAIGVFTLGVLAVELTPRDTNVAAWWPAAGVAAAIVAANYRDRRRLLALVVAASWLANIAGGRSAAVALGFALSNAAEAWVVAAWLNRGHAPGAGAPVLRRMTDVWKLLLATLLGALTIACGASLTVAAFGHGGATATFRNVIPSHAAAVLLLTPFLFAALPPVHRSPIERVTSWAVTVGVVTVVFWPGQELPLAFVTTAALLWTAVRLGLRDTAAQLIAVAVIVTILSRHGGGLVMGVDGGLSATGATLMLQAFILSNSLVLLPIATALAEREAALVRAHRIQAELELLALRDPLTGLPNRTALIEHLDRALADADDDHHRVAVMFFDLDDFKVVNDAYGHHVGDKVLSELASRFRDSIRPGDTLARVGGDEFVLMCPDVDSIESAMVIARHVLASLTVPVSVGDLRYVVNFRGGITISTNRSTSEEMLKEADVALYAAKAAGKRQISAFTRQLGDLAADRVRIETELRAALRDSEFEMHMQPVIDLQTGAIEAAEALIRWNHPVDGLRPPAVWLDIAERAGLMPELGAWVLDRSIGQAKRWIERFGADRAPIVHVNVSARQLDQPGFAGVVIDTLARHRFPPRKLVLELTETFLAQVRPELVDELDTLDRLGVRIAADDFGTGFSPLTRVLELPISMIKIDRKFISHAAEDPRALGVVDTLIQLSGSLHLDAVAEGVETADQLDVLLRLGCRSAQGYLWSRPVSGEEFEQMLATHRSPALVAVARD